MSSLKYPVLFIFIFFQHAVQTQVDTYVTVHFSSKSYVINSLTDMEERVNKKYTIHSSKAAANTLLTIGYDKYSKITGAEILYTDPTGMHTQQYKLKDFNDQALQDGYSLFSDNRVKSFRAKVDEYPVTIEYRYTIKHKNTLGLHSWEPLDDYRTAITHTELSFKSDLPGFVLSKEINFNGTKTVQDGFTTWSLDSIKALEDEIYASDENFTKILLSPSLIEMDGYQGKLKDWSQYGQWVNDLIRNRDILNPDDQAKIKSLIPEGSSIKTKINILYRYLQNNTRYVGIQLGIGGFQPMTATEVFKVGYGDCKALSNYMRALLKAVDIESFYTEIGNGSRQIRYNDFPSFYQTNHVILTVPLARDTTFLECTSQFFPPGYLGSSNSDRYAIMACPSGGQLIRTPGYEQGDNVRSTNSFLKLKSDGNASADLHTLFSGEYYEPYASFSLKSKKEQEDDLRELHPGMDYTVDSFNYAYDFNSIPSFRLDERLFLRKYASVSGTRIFIPLHLIQRYEPKASSSKTRMTDIKIPAGSSEFDTMSIDIPGGYTVETMPRPVIIANLFGSISSAIEIKNENILVVNHFVLFKNVQSKTTFPELSLLLEKTFKSTQSKIVLKKISP